MSHDNLHHEAIFRARQAVRWLNTHENARQIDFSCTPDGPEGRSGALVQRFAGKLTSFRSFWNE